MTTIVPQSPSPQTVAADPARSIFVTANAGSGKTTTLVNRVARLLLKGVSPQAVLCVTYTKAAAAEMQARLFDQLGGWAVMDDRALSEALARLDQGDPAALDHEALSRARRLFARALETPGGLKIQTIHAFCEKLLRRFPIEAGVSPRFTVLENEAAAELSRAAREDLARAALADAEGPIGAAYSHFAVELDWGRFNDLLALIEGRREAMVAYVEAAEAGDAPDPWTVAGAQRDTPAETLEADFLAWISAPQWSAAIDALSAGGASEQKLAAQMRACGQPPAAMAPMRPVFFKSNGEARDKFGVKATPSAVVEFLTGVQMKYLAVLDRIRAARVAEDTVRALTLARAHAALYEAAKMAQGALDFSDLVARTVELLTRAGAAAWVLYKLDGGIEHVLIDEAQDTAPDQWDIVAALTGEFFAGETRGRTIFAVGDEKQSIYSFQGARPERLRQEAQAYQARVDGAGGLFQEVPLDISYRSTPEVLRFVDAVFEAPDRTRALVGALGERTPHKAHRTDHAGSVELWPLKIDQPAVETDPWEPVDAEPARSGRKQLAQALAVEIRRQVEAGVAVHDKDGALRPCRYGDFLVLVRRRDATFEEVIRALKAEGVPVAGADRLRLSSHIAFDDLMALARFALFPEDDLSLAEVLRGPLCDIDEDSLFDLAGREKRNGLWRELKARAQERPEWSAARDLAAWAVAERGRDAFGFFSGALNRVDAAGLSGRARFLRRLGREAQEAIDETLNQALAAERRGAADLETGLALLEAAEVEVKRELEGPRGEVRVMTVHGAKGLEAPVVILPDTTARAKPQGPTLMPVGAGDAGEAWLMCPSSSQDDCPASAEARAARVARTDEETLRLLYVALTRARDRLIIMGRRSASRDAEAGSWWSVMAETFERLKTEGAAREVEDGVLRLGADPVVLGRGAEDAEATRPAVPAWAETAPEPDTAARLRSPSRMGETLRIPAPSPLAVAAGSGLGRFRRGDLIHHLLERLPEAAPDQRRAVAERMLGRERDLTEAQRQEMIAAALGVLEDDRFAAVFGPGSRAEAALAGTSQTLPAGVVLSGRVDRLVVTPERVLVVDYKTNRPAPDRIEDADPAYVLQMAAYVAVLERLYPDRPVEAALVWTDGPRLTPVPHALMQAALQGAR